MVASRDEASRRVLKDITGNGGGAFQGQVKIWHKVIQEAARMTSAKTPSNNRYIA